MALTPAELGMDLLAMADAIETALDAELRIATPNVRSGALVATVTHSNIVPQPVRDELDKRYRENWDSVIVSGANEIEDAREVTLILHPDSPEDARRKLENAIGERIVAAGLGIPTGGG